jgi:hypothetical protein
LSLKCCNPAATPLAKTVSLTEIVVDAYTSDERGWYYHLEEKLMFPFRAKCVATHAISLLKKGAQVDVVAMAPEDDCMQRMLVLVRFAGREAGVPLDQLEPLDLDESGRKAFEDWRYWVRRGYAF